MTKKLKKLHLVIILITGLCIPFASHANIAQAIQLILNFIGVNLAGFNANIQQESAGAHSTINALKMSADVTGGVIAEQTKQLLKNSYKFEFGEFGTVGEIKINSTAPSGCMRKKDASVFKKYAEELENAMEVDFKSINEYAKLKANVDVKADRDHRKVVAERAKQLGLDDMGFFPNRNLDAAEYELWKEMVPFLTVPKPISSSSTLLPGKRSQMAKNSERYKMLIGMVQQAMLQQGVFYKELEGEDQSRADIFKKYLAYANSFKRTKANNAKTKAGLERELAEAESILVDIETEYLERQETITNLMTILAISSTDEMADSLND